MKTIAAIAAGLLLVAGQAVASVGAPRVGDRLGAKAESSSEFAGVPALVLILGGVVLVSAIAIVADDDGDSN